MRKLTIILVSAFAFTSCIKQYEPEPYTDPCITGTLQFVNNSNNPYDIYVDDRKIHRQGAHTTYKYTIDKGAHLVRVEQVSGYLLEPTIEQYDGSVQGCKETVISYPQ